jgi:hypothetical protein
LQDTKSAYKTQELSYIANNEQAEKEIRKIITTSKKIKYLGINLTEEVKDLYNKNYKTLKKETEEYARRFGKTSHVHVSAELIL